MRPAGVLALVAVLSGAARGTSPPGAAVARSGRQVVGHVPCGAVTRALRLRGGGGGFAAAVPINRLLGRAAGTMEKKRRPRGHHGEKTDARGPTLSGRDAALIDALKNVESDTDCQQKVTQLLQSGANAGVQDPSSACEFCAIHLAAARGLTDAVSALVARGAAVDAPAKHGQTALSLAAARGHDGTVERLLSLGAAVSHRDMLGWTCLHQAAYYGSERVVQRLLEAGAEPGATTRDGSSPASLARQNPQTPASTAVAIADCLSSAAMATGAASGAQMGCLKLGDESAIMQAALAKGQRMMNATSASLSSIRQRYRRASMAPEDLERQDALAERALQSILDKCEGAAGSAGDRLKQAKQMLQQAAGDPQVAATLASLVLPDAPAGSAVSGANDSAVDDAAMMQAGFQETQVSRKQAGGTHRQEEGVGGAVGGGLGLPDLGRLSGSYQCVSAYVASGPGELTVQLGEDVRVEEDDAGGAGGTTGAEAGGRVLVSTRAGACGYIPKRCLVQGLPIVHGGGRGREVGWEGVREVDGGREAGAGTRKGGLTGGKAVCRDHLRPWSLLDLKVASPPADADTRPGSAGLTAGGGGQGVTDPRAQSHFSVRAKMSMPMDLRYGVEEDIPEAGGVAAAEARCGIGVTMTRDAYGRYIVTGVREDGPAAAVRDKLAEGSILEQVNGHAVTGISPAALTNLVVGPAKSEVRLTLSTPASPSSPTVLEDEGSASRSSRDHGGRWQVSVIRGPIAQPSLTHGPGHGSAQQDTSPAQNTQPQHQVGGQAGNEAGQIGAPQDAPHAIDVEEDFGEV